MSCSRWVSGGAFCRFWPISCSAMARSLSLISTPLTRATVGSEADPLASGFWEEASFEQPAAIGRTDSASAIMAKVVQRGRLGARLGSAAERRCGAVIGWSLSARDGPQADGPRADGAHARLRLPPAAEAGGELRNRLALAMAE